MIAVFDIDGVLADATHRQRHLRSRPKDWSSFFAEVGADPVIEEGVQRYRVESAHHDVVLMSGRPESTRLDTQAWLVRHGLGEPRLVLRQDSDFRPAPVVKSELIALVGPPTEVVVVVDDDEAVVARLAAMGYPAEVFR